METQLSDQEITNQEIQSFLKAYNSSNTLKQLEEVIHLDLNLFFKVQKLTDATTITQIDNYQIYKTVHDHLETLTLFKTATNLRLFNDENHQQFQINIQLPDYLKFLGLALLFNGWQALRKQYDLLRTSHSFECADSKNSQKNIEVLCEFMITVSNMLKQNILTYQDTKESEAYLYKIRALEISNNTNEDQIQNQREILIVNQDPGAYQYTVNYSDEQYISLFMKSLKSLTHFEVSALFEVFQETNREQIDSANSKEMQLYQSFLNHYKQSQNIFAEEKLDSLDFDIFEINKRLTRNYTLPSVAYHILNITRTLHLVNETKLVKFLQSIFNGYRRDVLYHNDLHGADVAQHCYLMLMHQGVNQVLNLDSLDILSFILAGTCHDFKHDGYTNLFHSNTFSERALLSNDIAVQESYHVSQTFRELQIQDQNFIEGFDFAQRKRFRKRMVESILSTDMAKHFPKVNQFIQNLAAHSIRGGINQDGLINRETPDKLFESQQDVLNMVIHAADLGTHARSWDLSVKWTQLLHDEFFKQASEENKLGLPTLPMMDRHTVDVSASQVGFINFFVLPLYQVLSDAFPPIKAQIGYVRNNCDNWGKHKYEHPERFEEE
eukprot:403375598